MSDHRLVLIKIREALILDALHFPKGTEIVRCVDDEAVLGHICLIVEHPDLPIVKRGERIPKTTPVLTFEEKKVVKFDWNLNKSKKYKNYGEKKFIREVLPGIIKNAITP